MQGELGIRLACDYCGKMTRWQRDKMEMWSNGLKVSGLSLYKKDPNGIISGYVLKFSEGLKTIIDSFQMGTSEESLNKSLS